MYACIHTCVHVYKSVSVYIYVCVSVYIHMYAYLCVICIHVFFEGKEN